MGFVEVHLSEEDKFKVLLFAFSLFLLALLCSICLAVSCCPLNKWLLERTARKKRQKIYHNQQQHFKTKPSTPIYLLTGGSKLGGSARGPPLNGLLYYGSRARQQQQQQLRQLSNMSAAAAANSFAGPPPGYEAALRATRLQSLTGTLPQLTMLPGGESNKQKNDWPPQMVFNGGGCATATAADCELDLGDYFHQPKEFNSLEPPLPHIQIPFGDYDPAAAAAMDHELKGTGDATMDEQQLLKRQAPVMLRLWVRMMEPGELVERARGSSEDRSQRQRSQQSTPGRMSIGRQLSIPQLFGSLVTLASSKQASLEGADQEESQQQLSSGDNEVSNQAAAERELHSIVSTSTNTSSTSSSEVAPEHHKPQDLQIELSSSENMGRPQNEKELNKRGDGMERQPRRSKQQPRRRSSSFLAINSVTSRVLHMNVASFSYVRDEQLISTKKHNQLNYHHFFRSSPSNKKTTQEEEAQKSSSTAASSKLCQLVISICDIENILNSCWLQEKSCALLAYSSAIYVQCEILLPKTKSARQLLSYPLRALNGQSSGSCTGSGRSTDGTRTHTVNFSTAISAAALERQQPPAPMGIHLGAPQRLEESLCNIDQHHLHPHSIADINQASSADTSLTNGSMLSDVSATSSSGCERQAPPPTQASDSLSSSTSSTNWRHEPHADGRSIVIFNSVPKQIAHEQELAAASLIHQQDTDLIQFDSVFASPILSKSTIQDGYLRFRVYSQCKYVNETCLAELKLPLKQLLKSETRDNLGDANLSPRIIAPNQPAAGLHHQSNQQRQADFILNNLLENLVTANTGSPLSTLIEQISTEEREAEELEQQQAGSPGGHGLQASEQQQQQPVSVFSRLPWLLSQQDQSSSRNSSQTGSSMKKLKLSNSLNESLYRLGSQAAASIYQQQQQATLPVYRQASNTHSDTQLYLGGDHCHDTERLRETDQEGRLERKAQEEAEEEEQEELEAKEAHERLMEQNYCRSLMVSHWLNYLVAPSYECQLSEESKGKIILGLSYLPTSNRLIFNAHKASIDNESYAGSGSGSALSMVKNLRLQSSTCYLLRFLMVVNGRVVKRKQTAVQRRPEWDSQEPITFDLASISVAQPHFIVALVMRNATLHSSTGSLQNLCHQQQQQPIANTSTAVRQCHLCYRRSNRMAAGALSEPETGQCRHDQGGTPIQYKQQQQQQPLQTHQSKRDLVIGHMVIGEEMWRELRQKPRKQIVRQFKIY